MHSEHAMRLVNDNQNNFKVVKNKGGCLVAEANECFYKIKKVDANSPMCVFEEMLCKAFAAEYKAMGLQWDVFMACDKTGNYRVEKRQKLQVLKPEDMDFSKVIAKSAKVRHNVETRLQFPYIMAQIRASGQLDYAEKLVLISEAQSNYSDYALTNDGSVVMLGMSKFVLALLNQLGSWDMCSILDPILISLDAGDFYFESYALDTSDKYIETIANPTGKFWLFPASLGDIEKVKTHFVKEFDQLLTANLEVLANKKTVPAKTHNDYGSFTEEVKRLGTAKDVTTEFLL